MATLPRKIDSSIVGLRWTRETSPGVLPGGTPVWEGVDPNTYEPSGADVKTKPRKTLSSRKRQKGPVVGLDASLGFEEDFCQLAIQGRLENLMMASYRDPGREIVTAIDLDAANPDEYEVASTTGFLVNSIIRGFNFAEAQNNAPHVVAAIVTDVSVEVVTGALAAETPPANAFIAVVGHHFAAGTLNVDASGALAKLTVTGGFDFTTLPLVPGQPIWIGGGVAGNVLSFANATNNGLKRIRSISATEIVIDKSPAGAMVTEDTTTETVQVYFGRVLKDEVGTDIVPITDQFERTLGAPDTTQPTQIQRQYFPGSVWNEAELNWPEEDTLSISSSYLNFDVENSESPHTPKTGSRPNLVSEEAYATTVDFYQLTLAVVDATTEVPSPLFTYIQDMNMTINNNASVKKSLTILGGFDVVRGTFEVDAELNPYFQTLEQQIAIRQSSVVTLSGFMAKNNMGFAFDCPVGTLSGGLLEIEIDEAVMSPLTFEASDGKLANSAFTHTLLWTFFDHLPDVAHPRT